MRRSRIVLLAAVLGLLFAVAPLPSLALSVPRTLVRQTVFERLAGESRVVSPAFGIDHLGVAWSGREAPSLRFRTARGWSAWTPLEQDELPTADGLRWSRLVPAHDARSYQLRGSASLIRAVAMNTTDGPRTARASLSSRAEAVTQPGVVSRAAWGTDESLRFKADGSEDWPQTWYATRKLIVHHTDTANNDPDPASTIRAIYRYHAVDQGWGDIGYNFLIDAQGRIYKGRYSGPLGTRDSDSPTGENAAGLGVTGAHSAGWNSGTMGIAVLGSFTSTAPADAAVQSLVDHLAWESQDDGIDPQATQTYVNPVSGASITTPNIAGHRDYVATQCPGDTLDAMLPEIRQRVASAVTPPSPDTTPPSAPTGLAATTMKKKTSLTWQSSTDAGGSGLAGYEVWRATSSAGPYTRIATTGTTSYSDGPPRRRTTNWYYVVAYDGAGNRSTRSNLASISG